MEERPKENLREVTVETVRSTGLLGEAVMVLKEKEGKRNVLIWIGPTEASSIAIALERLPMPRPLTHDLFLILFGRLGVRLQRVVITGLALGTYFARLEFEFKGEKFEIDARPSDGTALALRAGAPIFAAEELFDLQSDSPEGGGIRMH